MMIQYDLYFFSPLRQEMYRQKLIESLTLDTEGRPFRMLVFRGSPKSSGRWIRLIDKMRNDDAEALRNSNKQYQSPRQLPVVLFLLFRSLVSFSMHRNKILYMYMIR